MQRGRQQRVRVLVAQAVDEVHQIAVGPRGGGGASGGVQLEQRVLGICGVRTGAGPQSSIETSRQRRELCVHCADSTSGPVEKSTSWSGVEG